MLSVSLITEEELRTVLLDWSEKEGWNYSECDVSAYYKMNKKGIYVLKEVDDETKEEHLLGCLSLARYDISNRRSLYSVGLFIIKKEYRGLAKYGPILWQEVVVKLQRENSHAVLCLNSVPRAVAYYQRQGFFKTDILSKHGYLNASGFADEHLEKPASFSQRLWWEAGTQKKIQRYHRTLFGAPAPQQKKVMRQWFSRPDAIIVGYLSDETLQGYAVLTVSKQEKEKAIYRLSPFYSQSIDVAASLLKAVKMTLNPSAFGLEINALTYQAHLDLLEEQGFSFSDGGDTLLMVTDNTVPNRGVSEGQIIGLGPLELPHELCL